MLAAFAPCWVVDVQIGPCGDLGLELSPLSARLPSWGLYVLANLRRVPLGGLNYSLAINIDFGSAIPPRKVIFCFGRNRQRTTQVLARLLYATKR